MPGVDADAGLAGASGEAVTPQGVHLTAVAAADACNDDFAAGTRGIPSAAPSYGPST